LLSFHLLHGWSHSTAAAAIAEQTFDQAGIDWGGGIYINYAFCVFWLVDAGAWWLAPGWYERRSWWLNGFVQVVILFMFVNATVVFGKSPLRNVGGIICVAGAVGWIWNWRRLSPAANPRAEDRSGAGSVTCGRWSRN
jgi:hypothetical protein